MTSSSRLGAQLAELLQGLRREGIPSALIGGLALAAHRVIRATQDIDLLVDGDHGVRLNDLLASLGYHCLLCTRDVGNYARTDARVDFLFAHRPIARRLLREAVPMPTSFGTIQVISAEGLIGFKVQALVNDPRRLRDLDDIRALLRQNRERLNLAEVREYFLMFDQETLYERLIAESS